MNASEKFNSMIDYIEELVQKEELSTSEIGRLISQSSGRSVRDMSTIFAYLTDLPLSEYIVRRRLSAAYRLLANDKKSIVQVIGIAGYSDQAAFSKAFKREFGLTPKAAKMKGDMSPMSGRITWEELSGNSAGKSKTEEIQDAVQIFGVPEVSFEKIEKVMDLESFYGFSRMLSKYAFELSEKTGHTLDECFRYAESLREFGGDFKDELDVIVHKLTPEQNLHLWGDVDEYQELFFKRGMSVDMSIRLLNEHRAKFEELLNCDLDLIRFFPGFEDGVEMSFSYYIRACN